MRQRVTSGPKPNRKHLRLGDVFDLAARDDLTLEQLRAAVRLVRGDAGPGQDERARAARARLVFDPEHPFCPDCGARIMAKPSSKEVSCLMCGTVLYAPTVDILAGRIGRDR